MLEEIVARKKKDLNRFEQPEKFEVRHYSLEEALVSAANVDGIGLISEVKRASPSKGILAENLDVSDRAQVYERGGADAISVLTDGPYFQGSGADLTAVKKAVSLPVLRKDFIIDERQIEESARIGADAILLIAAVLSPKQLQHFAEIADSFGLESLVEIHTEEELNRILDVYTPPLLGVNNRDLKTFKTDLRHTEKIGKSLPVESLLVSESGIHKPDDVQRIVKAGAKAMLVGERLVTDDRPEDAIPVLKRGALTND